MNTAFFGWEIYREQESIAQGIFALHQGKTVVTFDNTANDLKHTQLSVNSTSPFERNQEMKLGRIIRLNHLASELKIEQLQANLVMN